MSDNLVSVIIPVYNSERYLLKCIESLQKQTYKVLEIILVDDGSSDTSPEICDVLAAKDARIKVVHKKNGGAAAARRTGIAQITGEYVIFVDADDWVEQDFVERLLTMALGKNADAVIGSYKTFSNDSYKTIQQVMLPGKYDRLCCEREIFPQMLSATPFYTFGIMPSMCGKLFRTDVVKKNVVALETGITFGEDGCFTYSTLLDCESIFITDESGYIYRQNSMSATHRFNEKLLSDGGKLKEFLENLAKKKNWDADTQIDEYMAYVCNYTVTSALKAGYVSSKEAKKRMNRYIKDNFPASFLSNPKFWQCTLKTRIRYILVRYNMLSLLSKFVL